MADGQPNIILITTDQQRTDTLGCYGSAFMQTPHLDGLAAGGICCERAYTTNPVCTPSRVSLFTGYQVSAHGTWNIGMNAPEDVPTIASRLGERGYRTHNIGKIHFQAVWCNAAESMESTERWAGGTEGFSGPYYGFQTIELGVGHTTFGLYGHYGNWVRSQVSEEVFRSYAKAEPAIAGGYRFGGEGYDWDLPVRLHSSTWTVDRAIQFLHGHDRKQPFFLSLGFQDPHHPHCLPRDFDGRVDPAAVPLPDYTEGELADKPPHFGVARAGGLEQSDFRGEYHVAGQEAGADFRRVTEADARTGRAYYYGMVRLIDEQMGRLLSYLEEAELAENTLVIFTSDHGELLGDHGLWMKGPFHYEQLVRVPLLMRWPQGFEGGRSVVGIVSQVDIVPTILSAAGLPADGALHGADALPLLRGEVVGIRDGALIECVDDPRKLRLKTYVTAERKLTWYNGHAFGELYDLVRDPREKVNLWWDPAYAADKSRLLGRMMERLEPIERRVPRISYA